MGAKGFLGMSLSRDVTRRHLDLNQPDHGKLVVVRRSRYHQCRVLLVPEAHGVTDMKHRIHRQYYLVFSVSTLVFG